MKNLALVVCLFAAAGYSQIKGHASGPFDVKMTPQTDTLVEGVSRMFGDKVLHGDLEGMGKGQMLAYVSEVKGSAVYVAIERITCTLQGRKGTFVLQHTGLMKRGAQSLTITVAPDSGTGELKGITGSMTIKIEADGKHFYEFDYTIEP